MQARKTVTGRTKRSDDYGLIQDVKKNSSSESLRKLCDMHAGIFLQIAKRWTGGTEKVKFPLEEVLDQKEAIVYDAIRDYDPSKGKFNTWLGTKLMYHCLNSFKAKTKYVPVAPEVMQHIVDSNQEFEKDDQEKQELEINYILSVLNQMQDERIRKIIYARYFSENKKHSKFAYIAKKLGMSTQGVIDLHNKFIEFMRRKVAATENMDQI